jgi:hypothetical protein
VTVPIASSDQRLDHARKKVTPSTAYDERHRHPLDQVDPPSRATRVAMIVASRTAAGGPACCSSPALRPPCPGRRLFDLAIQRDRPPSVSTAISATSVGVRPTRTPLASSASAFACAVPFEPDTIAPACPIVLPGGAVKPAM